MPEWIIEANDTEEMADGKLAIIRELVRCKDCKHKPYWDNKKEIVVFPEEDEYVCPLENDDPYCSKLPPDDYFFCRSGERREDGG